MTHFSGSWKTKQFKPYNFDARGAPPTCGHLHPLMKVRAEIRQIFLEMGWVAIATCHINLPHPQFISLHPSFPSSLPSSTASPRCLPTTSLRAHSGTLMLSSNPNSTLLEMHTTPSSSKVSPPQMTTNSLIVHSPSSPSPDPELSYDFPMDYLERVKTVHQAGGYGSIG